MTLIHNLPGPATAQDEVRRLLTSGTVYVTNDTTPDAPVPSIRAPLRY